MGVISHATYKNLKLYHYSIPIFLSTPHGALGTLPERVITDNDLILTFNSTRCIRNYTM